MVLALAVSALVGCTKDYSEDLAKIDGRLTNIEDKLIPDVTTQINTLAGRIDAIERDFAKTADLNAAKKALQDAITALETQHKADIDALKSGKADKTELQALVERVTKNENDIAVLNTYKARVENLEAKGAELAAALEVVKNNLALKADKTYVDATFETKADAAAMYEAIKNLIAAEKQAREDADAILQTSIANLDTKLTAAIQKVADDLAAEIVRAKAAEKALADDIVKIFGRLDVVEVEVDTLQAKVAALRTELDAEVAARIQTDKNLAELKAVVEAMYTNAEIDAMVKKLQDQITANAEAIEELEEKKLDIATWEAWLTDTYAVDKAALTKKIDDEIARAIAAEAANKEYIQNVESALNAFKQEYAAKMEEIDAAIADLSARVARLEAMAKRIQSISFVPEYVKGSAPVAEAFALAHYNGSGTSYPTDRQTVVASFQVEPAAKTKDVVEAIKSGDAQIVYVMELGTKAASKPKAAYSVYKVEELNGLVNVEAVIHDGLGVEAIALVYKEKNVEGQPYANNEIVSDYAPVATTPVEMTTAYKLMKGNTEYTDQPVKEEWVNAQAKHTWYEGYEYKVKVKNSFVAIEEAAKFYGVSVDKLTPAYSSSPTYPSTGNNTGSHAIRYKENTNYLEAAAWMNSKEDARKDIGEKFQSVGTFKVYGNQVMQFTNTYEIIKRQIDANLPDYTVVWNLKNIIALSSAKTAAALFNKPIDKTFDENLKEKVLTIVDEYDPSTIDLATIVNGGTPVTTVDGATVSGFVFDVDVTAHIEAQLADVSLAGYKDFFVSTGDSVKEIKNVYTVSSVGDAIKDTDVNVNWKVTFTAKDENAQISLSPKKLTYNFGDITYNIPVAETKTAMYARVKKLDATEAAWWAEFENNVSYYYTFYRYEDADALANSAYHYATAATPSFSYMKVYTTGDYSTITLREANISRMSNVFSMGTRYTTWYGVTYSWYSRSKGISLNPLSFGLAYWPELSKVASASDYDGKLTGKRIAELAYDMSGDGGYNIAVRQNDINRYFLVENIPAGITAAQLNKIKVVFDRTNENPTADAHIGMNNPNPYVSGTPFTFGGLFTRDVVEANGKIADLPVNWMYYDARNFGVEAQLQISKTSGGVIHTGDNLELTLVLEDPLAISADEELIEVKRDDIMDVTYDLDANVIIKAIHRAAGTEANLLANENGIWVDLAQPAGRNAGTFYNVQYSVELGEVRLGSKNGDVINFPTTTLAYDEVTHVITYFHDAALQQKDLYVQVKLSMVHQFDWFMGKQDAHTAEYWVRLYQID